MKGRKLFHRTIPVHVARSRAVQETPHLHVSNMISDRTSRHRRGAQLYGKDKPFRDYLRTESWWCAVRFELFIWLVLAVCRFKPIFRALLGKWGLLVACGSRLFRF